MKTSNWLIWIGLAAIALSIGAAIFAASLSPRHTYTPTGDEMFDRFALLLLDQISPSKSRSEILLSPFTGGHPTSDPLEIVCGCDKSAVITWQAEYGDRSDYWDLRFQTNRSEADLLQAIARGQAGYAAFHVFDLKEMVKTNPQQALSITDQAIGMNPENSYYYYQKAALLIMLGDIAKVRQALRAGNAAELNVHPKPYGQRMVEKHLLDATDPDSKMVALYVLATTPIPLCLHIRKSSQKVLDAVAKGEDREFINEWLTFNRRMAQMDGACLIEILVALSAERVILAGAPDCLELTDDELASLQAAEEDHAKVNSLISQLIRKEPRKQSWLDSLDVETNMLDYSDFVIQEVKSLPELQRQIAELDVPEL